MKGVAIYFEGGGDSKDSKAALRQGMDAFLGPLKDAARAKSLRWKVVPCGGRNQAFDAFRHACDIAEMSIIILLVDSEGPVIASPRDYLIARDGWALQGVHPNLLHLMIQTMETWIVSDVTALAEYYGQRFNQNVLPKTQNLEQVARAEISAALERATRPTQKGRYHKIRHASDLLARLDTTRVRERCSSCGRAFATIAAAIAAS